ncbi:Glycine--tRNA ligase chloroplastic/mitochondrial 2 [Zea mays]|uniref:glycine--tRNA ligase n=1 Tax=Zea mays TaxID=4577 RepID=A0A1D6NXM3_MAIZE|nr:Glycine--tRNA ligase chloroplastic/mitochondrial 2 [Zea mays]
MFDLEERKEKVLHASTVLAQGVGGDFIAPDSLLQEVVNLVEAPVPILGRYDDSFLELPKDVLITVMQKHQKYFAVISKSTGDLLPYFIAVANGAISKEVVRKGNEAVLRARYEDAKFFYKMDTQKKFSEFRGQLSGILFHEKLGTMLDKMTRVENTVAELALILGINERTVPIIKDAAALAMSDLATSIVTEFTSLAGIMARHYALRDSIPEEVVMIFQYGKFGTNLLDSLVGLFGAGCQPSSTNDPFGLRRVSYGLVQILVENKKSFDLRRALTLLAGVQPIAIESDVIDEVDEGINCEIVRSVLMERANCPYLAAQTATEMEAFSRTETFQKIVEAYSRPTRIIRGKEIESALEVDPHVFEKDEEKVLWSAYLEVADKIHPGVDIKTFVDASLILIQPLEDFFNSVFVMAEDERVRNNRLTLLRKIESLPKGIADLSVLPGF